MVALIAVCTACSSTTTNGSSAAPPLRVCNTTLSAFPAGAVMADATGPMVRIAAQTAGDVVIVKLSQGCKRGADYTIDPPTAATVSKRALADDDKAAALVLQPRSATFDIRITHPDGSTGIVQVRLGKNFISTKASTTR
jgi:hypothetical protein